jgi:hypothetical protein
MSIYDGKKLKHFYLKILINDRKIWWKE